MEFEEFEWDPSKDESNKRKHNISFKTAARIFLGPVLCRLDDRSDYGEDRFIAVGTINDVCIVVVYTLRSEDICRIISAWRANKNEREAYYEAVFGQRSSP